MGIKTVAILGAGNRGMDVYGKLIKERNDLKIVAVAEKNKLKRNKFAKKHSIPPIKQFNSWEDLLIEDKLADGIIIATGDKDHYEPLIKSLKKGYKVLCEKPITDNYKEMSSLYNDYSEYSNDVMVSHVLRYTPFFRKIKEIIKNGEIGSIRFINLIENIGFFHFAHSYVRGNWRNKSVGAPIILAKSCHDLDILYWLLESQYLKVYSDTSKKYFNKENIIEGAGYRCLQCNVEDTCPYSAKKIYLNTEEGWPVSTITEDLSESGRINALNNTNYGKCVYRSDNEQHDVQSLLLKFNNGINVHFTLHAFSKEMTRKININGTYGEIEGNLDKGTIEIKPFLKNNRKIKVDHTGGHAGGDEKLIDSFASFLNNKSDNITNLLTSLESHFAALAAEQSRIEDRAIYLEELRRKKIE
jgi:predicted dehydrogenase